MSLSFQNFKPVLTANTRDNSHLLGKGAGQNFTLKFRKFTVKKKDEADTLNTSFTLSNAKFKELDLDNKGMMEFVNEGKSYLGVVDNDNAVFYRRNKKNEGVEKGKTFKSTILEKSLSEAGLINLDIVGDNQKLTLALAEGSQNIEIAGIKVYGLYEIGKDETPETEEDKAASQEDETDTTEVPETSVTDVPATEPQGTIDGNANQAAPEASVSPAPQAAEDDF